MTVTRMVELLEIEQQCVAQGESCDRDCAHCPLVQDTQELLEMYDFVIDIVKRFRKEMLS